MNEYDDRENNSNANDPARAEIIERAKAKASPPGILLIIFGLITFGLSAWSASDLKNFDQKLADAMAKNDKEIQADPQLNDEQKKDMKEMVEMVVDIAKKVVPPLVFVNLAAGALLVLGGFCLMKLSASWLVLLACIVAILPFTTACCSGLPFGIWALIALNSQAVKAGYRAKAMGT